MRKKLPVFMTIFFLMIVAGSAFVYLSNRSLQTKVYRFFYPSRCDTPIDFKIGRVDAQFGLEREIFQKQTISGANIWNQVYGESIFQYNPAANLTVNLVFDERQRLTNQINQLSGKISFSEENLKPEIAKHQREVAEFEAKMANFNDRVRSWNNQGGAPEEEYNKLVDEQQSLKNEADKLNTRASDLHLKAVSFNSEIKNYNETVTEFNATLESRPEEGLFDGKNNAITVYFYIDDEELKHTLAHEFGHALSMEHVNDPKAIMNAKTNSEITPAEDDLSELTRVCSRKPVWEKLRDRNF